MPKINNSELQKRLRNRWPGILARAQELRCKYPDPIQALSDLLNNILIDRDTWKEVVEEPYA